MPFFLNIITSVRPFDAAFVFVLSHFWLNGFSNLHLYVTSNNSLAVEKKYIQKMKICMWVVTVFILCLILHQFSLSATVKAANLVQETCNKTRYSDVCLETLKSDPNSKTADVKGLARIMLKHGLAYSKDTYARVNKMFNETKDPIMKSCLHVCSEIYSLSVEVNFPHAITALENNDYRESSRILDSAYDDPETCNDAFVERPVIKTPPFTDRNNYLEKMIDVACTIVNSLYS